MSSISILHVVVSHSNIDDSKFILPPYCELPCNKIPVDGDTNCNFCPTYIWNCDLLNIDRFNIIGRDIVIFDVNDDADMVTGNESTIIDVVNDVDTNSILPELPDDEIYTSAYIVISFCRKLNVNKSSVFVIFLYIEIPL